MYKATKYRNIATIFLTMTIGTGIPGQLLADSAAVLPTNVSRAYLDFYRYQPTTQRYNADGNLEDLAFPFSNATVDSTVLTVLAPLDPLVSGPASIGDVAVAYQYDIDILDIGYNYGLTNQLSIGFHIPYYWITNNVDTSFSSVNANVGLISTTGGCCEPIASGGQPMTIGDVQNLIKSQYGFDAVETWQRDGVGDIEMGAKYQLYQKQNSAFSVTGGLRIPSGYEDNADILTDVAWSYGNYAALLRLNYDYLVSNLWRDKPNNLYQELPLAGDVIINLTFRFDYMLPDTKVMRVGDIPDQVFTNNIERVSRKLGDLYNIEVSGKYQATDSISLSAIYTYGWKSKDDISGTMGFNYASLEANTDSSQQIIILALNYSTLAAYRNKQSAIPMEFSIAYRDRFKGDGPRTAQTNPVLHTSWVVASMKILF